MITNTDVVVFTHDLRVADNPALSAASQANRVVPLFVFDNRIITSPKCSANRLKFLIESVDDLDGSLHKLGGRLIVRRGDWVSEVARIVSACSARRVHVSAGVSAFSARRTRALRAIGLREDFEVVEHPGISVVAPGALLTGGRTPYQMFTPYFRRWLETPWRTPASTPSALRVPDDVDGGPRVTLHDLTQQAASPHVIAGGERQALRQLQRWAEATLESYAEIHDSPASDLTSKISGYLHFGCLSPLDVASRLREQPGAFAFVRQLSWRDFFHQLLAARPDLADRDMRDRGTPSGAPPAVIAAWSEGRTGFPLVDAGMRQLQTEGFMHNRVRMVVASFLTKDLDVAWQVGARHFMKWLVDGDVACNQLNWQWVAGTGTDANPHRIFNPIRQSERFDPDGTYIRRHVAELREVTAKEIHDPADDTRDRCGYPSKIVDHHEAIHEYRERLRVSRSE